MAAETENWCNAGWYNEIKIRDQGSLVRSRYLKKVQTMERHTAN